MHRKEIDEKQIQEINEIPGYGISAKIQNKKVLVRK